MTINNAPPLPQALQEAMSPQTLEQWLTWMTGFLTETHHQALSSAMPVLPFLEKTPVAAERYKKQWQLSPNHVSNLLESIGKYSQHLHHPRFMGAQVTSPLPLAVAADAMAGYLNNSLAVFEMGPVGTAMESALIHWMAEQIGYDPKVAGGFFSNGGALGTLTALLTARQVLSEKLYGPGFDVWKQGYPAGEPLPALLVSEHAHFCAKRAAQILGWGEDGVILVKTDSQFAIDPDDLPCALQTAIENNRRPIALVASACNTPTGSFDPLEAIADFCEANGLWMHVDGAHGAPTVLSQKYKHWVSGIHRADSVVWDCHKMMLMPLTCTAIVYKNGQNRHKTFQQQASYLLGDGKNPDEYNLAAQTLECSKRNITLPLYVSLSHYSPQFFEAYLDYTYDLTRAFADYLEGQPDFILVMAPQSNILCFQYHCPRLSQDEQEQLQGTIVENINESGAFYIGKTTLPGWGTVFRLVIINPHTTPSDLEALCVEIRNQASLVLPSEANAVLQ